MANPNEPLKLNIAVPDPDVLADAQAVREEQAAVKGDYGETAQRDSYIRNRYLLNAIAQTGRLFLFVVQVGILVIGLTLLAHYVIPSNWMWLPDERIEKIETFLTGSIVTGIAVLVRAYLNRQP